MLNLKSHLNKNLFNKSKLEKISTRDGYGKGLVIAGKKNKNIVVLCADLANSTRVAEFKEKFPKRFIECGIAEQNMMGLAAGMAFVGKIPFVSSFSVFSPGVNWSQLRVSVCQNNANTKIAGSHSGVSVGEDGMSHQGLEDIAITRCLPGLVVLAPCDFEETKKAVLRAVEYNGPVYIRFERPATSVLTTEKTPFKIGKAEIFRRGKDVTIVACGPLLYNALIAAESLSKQGIEVEIINNHTIKPIDEKTLIKSAKKTKAIVTIENHQVIGGLGSAVAEVLSKNYPVPIEIMGVQDKWGESGKPDELIEKYGMGIDSIIKTIKKVLKRK